MHAASVYRDHVLCHGGKIRARGPGKGTENKKSMAGDIPEIF